MTDSPVGTGGVGFAIIATLTAAGLDPVSLAQGGEDASSARPLGLDVLTTGTTGGYLVVECDPARILKSEPCDPGGPDVTNGGCNSSPPVFSPITCGASYCGDSYFDGNLRDTDWFEITTTAPCIFTWSVVTEFQAVVGRVENDGLEECEGVTAFAEVTVGGCGELAVITAELEPGTYWFYVGPQFTHVFLCDPAGDNVKDYNASLSCTCTIPCPWDIDGNGTVGFADLLEMLSNWGPCPSA